MSVRRVSIDRWREAQEWELGLWKEAQTRRGWHRLVVPVAQPILAAFGSDRGQGDDWNHWWADRFDDYSFLPKDLGDYIELGCGPFTNTRLITRGRTARRLICSDPLVRTYIHFKHRWLADAYREGLILIDDHPLEEIPYAPATFDVVVVINVLDHVYDFDLCMTNAVGLVRPGGYFVIGQDLANEGRGPGRRGRPPYSRDGRGSRGAPRRVRSPSQEESQSRGRSIPRPSLFDADLWRKETRVTQTTRLPPSGT